MALPFNTEFCTQISDDSSAAQQCGGGCGWKCDCHLCTASGSESAWPDCKCPCRFWVVVCFVVLLGFFVVFFAAAVFRRTVLYVMASAAVALGSILCALAAATDQCGWPAFFSISLVFVFPCAYSCAWQLQQRRATAAEWNRSPEQQAAGGQRASAASSSGAQAEDRRAKADSSVLMVFPGGDMMLGVRATEDDNGKNSQREADDDGKSDGPEGDDKRPNPLDLEEG